MAIIDGWGVFFHDPSLGTYEKAFSTYEMSLGACPRGIAYLSQGVFAGNFLLSDVMLPETLYLCTPEGALLGVVRAEGTGLPIGEGLVQITSGPDQGRIARLAGGGDQRARFIYIFRLEQGDGEIRAVCEKCLTLPVANYVGIAFLPADFPGHPNSFVVSEGGAGTTPLRVIDGAGQCVAEYAGFDSAEGLAYFSSGPYAGKLLLADTWLLRATVRSLDGSVSTASSLPRVGVGVAFYDNSNWVNLAWLKDRQQLHFFGMDGPAYNTHGYLISRQAAGLWHADSDFRLTHYRGVRNITDITRDGTHKLFGWIATGTNRRAGFDRLDAGLNLLDSTELPIQYTGLLFGNLTYVPGETPAGDRYAIPAGKAIYSFNTSFSYPAEVKDISGLVGSAITKMCFDPAVRRFYVLDAQTLRIFDSGWRPLGQYDLKRLSLPNFTAITKITSGDLRNHIALMIGADQEVVFVNFEYEIAGDLLQRLIDEVLAAGLDKGRTNSLVQKLKNALRSVEEERATPAINQVEAFQNEVGAQRGKDISAALADRWTTLAADVILGLQALL